MPVCVTGMHRSGTSMVVRLLNICGLYLGAAGDLVPPTPDNPEGYWENVRFQNISVALLESWGGAWDVPPPLPQGWEKQADAIALRGQAQQLLKEFTDCPRWGWKDPRASLTLPFWQMLLPDLRAVICVRNPLEVAASLRRRAYSSNAFAFGLWQTYNERLLGATTPERRLVTHYEAYFGDPEAELQRVVDWLGWSVPAETIIQACAAISTPLRHHRVSIGELEQARISREGLGLYQALCSEAGPVYERSSRDPAPGPASTRPSLSSARTGPDTPYMQQLVEQRQEIEELEQKRLHMEAAFEAQARWARELEEMAREHQATIRAYQLALAPALFLVRLARQVRKRFGGG